MRDQEDDRRGRPLRVGVIGSGGRLDRESAEAARRVGAALARRGAVLVCGGLGGVMEAAAAGAREAGGTVLGILPGSDAGAAAPGVSIPLPTGLGEARNVLVVRSSEAVVAIAGGWGTLSEAAFCLKLGVPLFGLRDHLPAEMSIERLDDPEEAAERALRAAGRRRATPSETARTPGGIG
jgi:hypothetical protein